MPDRQKVMECILGGIDINNTILYQISHKNLYTILDQANWANITNFATYTLWKWINKLAKRVLELPGKLCGPILYPQVYSERQRGMSVTYH